MKTLPERNQELLEEMFTLINYMSNDDDLVKLLAEMLPRQHRTIQQNFIRLLKSVIENYAKSNLGTDLRNEGAVEWAKKVAQIEGYLPFI